MEQGGADVRGAKGANGSVGAPTPPSPELWAKALEHEGLIDKVASQVWLRYRYYGISFEEIKSYGWEGLLKALEQFDPTKGYSLATYAFPWIKNTIGNGVRTLSRQQGAVRGSDGSIIRNYQFYDITLLDSNEDGEFLPEAIREQILERIAEHDAIPTPNDDFWALVDSALTDDERTVLGLVFVQGLRHSEAAEELGYSRTWVSNKVRSIIRTLRVRLGLDPEITPTKSLSMFKAEDVVSIRSRYRAGGITYQALADEYGCSPNYIALIVKGQRGAGAA